jgi:prepilin-type N-terminal cleavage/methylation domain-containing protein
MRNKEKNNIGFTLLNPAKREFRPWRNYLTGFTLIELLVAVFIIVLISSIVFIDYRAGDKQFALQRSTYMLAQDIRRVQEMAMRAEDFRGTASRGGWGIRLESATSSYILFADPNENRVFDFPGEKFERRELEREVTITSISPNPSTIVFIPPDPGIRINTGIATSTTITLGIGGYTARVIVNNAGLIAIE